jgi:peptidoglycan/xylan/chitin deacetylase (PgdA/CDA1 family)
MYLIKTPFWLKAFYSKCVWDIPSKEKVLYLTFDDGPHPEATDFVLAELKKHNAKATFFCIGNNVLSYPNVYENIIAQGHAVGNHTYDHLNGWETDDIRYFENIAMATQLIDSPLFRPPYGRIKRAQIAAIKNSTSFPNKIIMWDVLSADFDIKLSGETCARNVIKHAGPGSIIVFHDSTKAWDRLSVALPIVLNYFTELGYRMEAIPTTSA